MSSRGHGHLAVLKRDYTLAQVLLLQEAAEINRRQEQLDLAQAVALGIAEAFQPQAQLLDKLREKLIPKAQTAAGEETAAAPDPRAIAALFGVPLAE